MTCNEQYLSRQDAIWREPSKRLQYFVHCSEFRVLRPRWVPGYCFCCGGRCSHGHSTIQPARGAPTSSEFVDSGHVFHPHAHIAALWGCLHLICFPFTWELVLGIFLIAIQNVVPYLWVHCCWSIYLVCLIIYCSITNSSLSNCAFHSHIFIFFILQIYSLQTVSFCIDVTNGLLPHTLPRSLIFFEAEV